MTAHEFYLFLTEHITNVPQQVYTKEAVLKQIDQLYMSFVVAEDRKRWAEVNLLREKP